MNKQITPIVKLKQSKTVDITTYRWLLAKKSLNSFSTHLDHVLPKIINVYHKATLVPIDRQILTI